MNIIFLFKKFKKRFKKRFLFKLNAGIVIKFILVKLVGQLARALKNI